MLEDNVQETDICGWNIETCIRIMKRLNEGDPEIFMHYGADELGWGEATYKRVFEARIPTHILRGYSVGM